MIGAVLYFSTKDAIANDEILFKQWINRFIYTSRTFGVTHMFLICPQEPPRWTTEEMNFKMVHSLTEVTELYPGVHYVGLIGTAKTLLREYPHRKDNEIYVVGSDYGDINEKELSNVDHTMVRIDTDTTTPLWADQALTVALYSRKVILNWQV